MWAKNDLFFWLDGIPTGKAIFFGGGGIGQRNVTYREKVAMWCGCSVPAAE